MGKRVVIVDDTVFMRMSLKNFLESFDYEVVKEGSDGFEAVTLYKRLKPDIITTRQRGKDFLALLFLPTVF